MAIRPWRAMVAVGLLLGAIAPAFGVTVVGAMVQIVGWGAIVATWYTSRNEPKRQRGPWVALMAAGGLFLVAGIVRAVHASISGIDRPFPSPADPLIMLSYLCLILTVTRLRRLRSEENDREGLIDGALVAIALGVVLAATALAPYVADHTVPVMNRGVNVAFSVLSLTLVACVTRLAVGPGARTTSYYLLAIAAAALLTADVSATLESVNKGGADLAAVLGPLVFVCFAGASTHPEALRLTERPESSVTLLTWRRLAMLGAALLVAPGLLIIERIDAAAVDGRAVIAGAIGLSILVLLRLAMLVRARERATEVEQVLRQASAALATSSSRHLMYRSALDAVSRLADGCEDLRVSMAEVVDGTLQIVDATGHRADLAVGTATLVAHLPGTMAADLAALHSSEAHDALPLDLALGGDPATYAVLVAPLVARNQLSGAIVVTTAEPLARGVRNSIESLTSTVSLALESALLTEDLLRRRSERRFRALVDNSSDIVLVVAEGRKITFASPAAQRLLGLPGEALLSTDPAAWVHPDDRTIVTNMLATTNTDGHTEVGPHEIRFRHVDGSYRWFDVRTRDLYDDPEILGVVVNAREITDRKAAEQLLATSEARFRSLVQHSSDVVAVVDERGRFTYVSPAITAVLGVTPDELVGTTAADILPAEELYRLRRQSPELADRRLPAEPVEPMSIELQLRHTNGTLHAIDMTVTDLRHEPAVQGIVLNARDVTVRKALERDLRHQALHDALTGLANRAMFTERVDEALNTEDGRLLGTLFIDLDDFKTVNDSLGHAVGDELLLRVAERLLTCLQPTDVAARLGGDEFAVLVVSPWGQPGVVRIADRILLALQAPFTIKGREIRISASIGIATDEDRSSDAEVLLRNADMAMYLAKDRGKSRYEVFEEGMHATVFERLELKADLARGIEDGQLRLLYQPIVSLQTGRITGVEALVRWDHPRRGMLSPQAFVGLAEDTGLILPLGQWVLEEACQQLRAWQLSLPSTSSLTMSVNLSVRQLQHENIVRDVIATIDRFGLDASTITLEITETTLMHDTDVTRRTLAELRDAGVSLAVDDFGTGYSSLQYVQRFPIDSIKIDRSFVSGLGEEAGDTAVVQSMIELAQRLGVHTVAEGIERPEQITLLQALGADLGQGYLFSRPVHPDQIGELLHRSISEGTRFLLR
ncbi:MAG: diguanylate cyclase/phosphodiesterase with sensor(s) [Acidimicrobiales bacterium]|nr:diguanylate cyclase/phosphodiesterase with sensor(s) [Acidimicrobiales bacterium]